MTGAKYRDILLCSSRESGQTGLLRHFGDCFEPLLFCIRDSDLVLPIVPLEWPLPIAVALDGSNSQDLSFFLTCRFQDKSVLWKDVLKPGFPSALPSAAGLRCGQTDDEWFWFSLLFILHQESSVPRISSNCYERPFWGVCLFLFFSWNSIFWLFCFVFLQPLMTVFLYVILEGTDEYRSGGCQGHCCPPRRMSCHLNDLVVPPPWATPSM